MADLTFWDAAFPPADPPAADGVCIYVGGDATHVWTAEEIGMQPARYRLPIFVRSNPPGPGAAADVAAALARLHVIGAPKGTLVAWDMETAADPAYIRGVCTGMASGGYKVIVYGSESTVRGNKVPDGLYFGADWTGRAHLHAGDAMTQWVSFAAFDEDEARPGLPFWDTQKPRAVPPAKAPTVRQPRPWTTAGRSSLAQLAADHGTVPSTILRLTAERSPGAVFDPAVASFVNGVFSGKTDPGKPMPAGLRLWLLA